MARATLPDSKVRWASYIDDYDLIRDQIAQVYPAIYSDFGERIKAPRGFHLDIPPRRRVWPTPNVKANFLLLQGMEVNPTGHRSSISRLDPVGPIRHLYTTQKPN